MQGKDVNAPLPSRNKNIQYMQMLILYYIIYFAHFEFFFFFLQFLEDSKVVSCTPRAQPGTGGKRPQPGPATNMNGYSAHGEMEITYK